MITPHRFYRVLVFALCRLSTLGLERAQAAQKSAKPTIKIRISQSAVGAHSTILWSAQELGPFARHDLEAEVIYLRTSPIQMTAFSTGEVQFAVTGSSPVLSTAVGGQDVKIISSPSDRLSYDLVDRPEIKEVKDLCGNRLCVTSMGGTVWMAAYLTLEHLGLDTSRDQMRINDIGKQIILAQAMESAQIDATLLDPFLGRRIRLKGLPVLVELQRAKIPFTNSAWAVSGSYLRDHPETIQAVLKAMLEAHPSSPRRQTEIACCVPWRIT